MMYKYTAPLPYSDAYRMRVIDRENTRNNYCLGKEGGETKGGI